MYMPSPYEAVLRKLVVAAADAKLAEAAPRLFAEDAVLHVPGSSPLAGDHHGPAAIADAYFRRQRDLTAGTLTVEPVRMDVRDTRGVLIYDVPSRPGEDPGRLDRVVRPGAVRPLLLLSEVGHVLRPQRQRDHRRGVEVLLGR